MQYASWCEGTWNLSRLSTVRVRPKTKTRILDIGFPPRFRSLGAVNNLNIIDFIDPSSRACELQSRETNSIDQYQRIKAQQESPTADWVADKSAARIANCGLGCGRERSKNRQLRVALCKSCMGQAAPKARNMKARAKCERSERVAPGLVGKKAVEA